jgi:hypothetical protein
VKGRHICKVRCSPSVISAAGSLASSDTPVRSIHTYFRRPTISSQMGTL